MFTINWGNIDGGIIAHITALWKYRGYVATMVKREFRIGYLGSLLGSTWSILNPMARIFIYTVIFSRVMKARISGVDDTMAYSLFLCAGLLPWTYFSELMGRCPTLFIDHANLLKKANFPRVILPVVLFLSTSINFIITFSIFLIFLLVTSRFPGWSIIGYFPLLIIQQFFVLGLGLSLGTLNVFFRDIGQIVGIALQFWFWFTPIVYPISVLSERARNLIELNPMAPFIVAYQNIILHNRWPQLTSFWLHMICTIAILLLGYLLFRKLCGDIVDEL